MLLSVALVSCSSDGSEPRTSPGQTGQPRPSASAQRGITDPKGVIVTNVALGATHGVVERAVSDLKEVGLWRRLTKHLYEVKFGSRNGRSNVPEDGHLADAFLTAKVEGNVGGTYCDILFFPAAMDDDLERWRSYYSQGLLTEEPPTRRQFWASIMGHELGHCVDGPHGEATAQEWEARTLEALRAGGIE